MQANRNPTNIENPFLMLPKAVKGFIRRREKSLLHLPRLGFEQGGYVELFPPSFGSASTVFPSPEKKVNAPVSVSTLTVRALVDSLISFFTETIWKF